MAQAPTLKIHQRILGEPSKWTGNNHEFVPTQTEAVIWWALKAVDTI